MEFSKTDKMAFLVRTNHHLLPVIHRFGIRLGFGNKTVEQLCHIHHIDSEFFLTIVNTFHNPNYFPEERLLSFSPLLIIDYLNKTHVYYKKYSLPKIENILHQLLESISQHHSEHQMIEEFYLQYKNKLLQHIDDEERKVFPYIEKLIREPQNVTDKSLRLSFKVEHEHVDFEIDDLKNLILKFIVPDYDELLCNELIAEIFRFEKDIRNHARIEDAILIPQVRQLQNNL